MRLWLHCNTADERVQLVDGRSKTFEAFCIELGGGFSNIRLIVFAEVLPTLPIGWVLGVSQETSIADGQDDRDPGLTVGGQALKCVEYPLAVDRYDALGILGKIPNSSAVFEWDDSNLAGKHL